MSKGLGKIERKIMNIVTYPNVSEWINLREIIQIIDDIEPPVYEELKGKSFNEKIKFLCCREGQFIYCRCRFVFEGKEGISFYQSLMRALRSLERKGFILSQMENLYNFLCGRQKDDEEFKRESKENPPVKEISFNTKCLINGIPWQLKYLNKRLTKIRGVQSD